MEKGILYVATDDYYVSQAKRSARITKENTDVPVALITHRSPENCGIFDEIIIDDSPKKGYIDKARNMLQSPFEKTLLLDTDAYMIERVPEVWELLEHHNLAAAIDANEGELRFSDKIDEDLQKVPEAFPIYNTGVIAYKQSVKGFIQKWIKNHSPENLTDQTSFRLTLFEEEVDFAALNNNYNCYIDFPTQVCGEVKIVHDFHMKGIDRVEDVGSIINQSERERILYYNSHLLYSIYGEEGKLVEKASLIASYIDFAREIAKEEGWEELLKRVLNKAKLIKLQTKV